MFYHKLSLSLNRESRLNMNSYVGIEKEPYYLQGIVFWVVFTTSVLYFPNKTKRETGDFSTKTFPIVTHFSV